MGLFDFMAAPQAPRQQLPASQQPAAQPATPSAQPAATATPAVQGSTADPSGTPAPVTSPLDKFSSLWQTTATGGEQATDKSYVSMDPAKLAEATGKLNFTAGLQPEQLQAVFSGGDQAVQAFQTALNSTAQQSFQTAMIGASRLIEQALKSQRQDVLGEIPGLFKNQMLTSQVFEENPALSHPSVRPLIEVLQTQFAAKFPEASNSELRKMAADYLTQTASLVSGKGSAAELPAISASAQFGAQGAGTQPDWDNFFSTPM